MAAISGGAAKSIRLRSTYNHRGRTMLAMSARIIMKNLWFYLSMALLIVALETMNGLGLFGKSSHAGVLFVCAYLSANLPLVILHGISLTDAVNYRKGGRLAAGFKVALIAAIIVSLTLYLFLKTAYKGPGVTRTNSDYLALIGALVLVLPAAITLLGSWIPAGLMHKDPGFVSAIGRGIMSIHTVYWRLALALAAYILLATILGTAYILAVGTAPSLTTDAGGLDTLGIAHWYVTMLLGMFLLTYINVVICMDYMRFEKISLDDKSGATPA